MSFEELNKTTAEVNKSSENEEPEVSQTDIDSRVEPLEPNAVDVDKTNDTLEQAAFDPDARVDVSEPVINDEMPSMEFDPDQRVEIPETEPEMVDIQEPNEQPAESEVDDEADVPTENPLGMEESSENPVAERDMVEEHKSSYDATQTAQDEIVNRKNNEKESDDKQVSKEENKQQDALRSEEVNAEEIKQKYADELLELSPEPDTIDVDKITNMKVKDISPEDNAKKHSEYRKNKEDMIKDWERIHNREWPTYSEDVYSDSGKLLRRKGDKYDAHHIQPLSKNGENTAENITPLHVNDHYDHKGIHAPGGSCSKLK